MSTHGEARRRLATLRPRDRSILGPRTKELLREAVEEEQTSRAVRLCRWVLWQRALKFPDPEQAFQRMIDGKAVIGWRRCPRR